MVSLSSKYILSAVDVYKDLAIPDVITVRIDDSDEEEGFREVVVEIEDHRIIKPWLGGYVHTESGIEYHHGYTQTGPRRPKAPPEKLNHRDTQTYWLRNRKHDTTYERATQMANENVYIPSITDKIKIVKEYETADERDKRRDVEGKVGTIQRYFRAWKIRKALKVLSVEYRRRVALQLAEDEFDAQENVDRKKREIICKIFPRSKTDFCILYALVEQWKRSEINRICTYTTGAAKMAEFYMLLETEIKMLRAIERHREAVKADVRIQKDQEFLKLLGDPLKWNSKYKNLEVSMDTLETQKGREYRGIYFSLCDLTSDTEDRIQALLNLKLSLKDHNCQVGNQLVNLANRAVELMVRGIDMKHLDMLMKRIQVMFLWLVKDRDCSFGVTHRMVRVKEKLMHKNLFLCSRCYKFKLHEQFVINPDLKTLRVCRVCSWDDRTMEPWIDLAPYQFMLRSIRREERRKKSQSSVAFILTPRDIHYIVMTIWHGHSALSERKDLYNLVLCRWSKDDVWTP